MLCNATDSECTVYTVHYSVCGRCSAERNGKHSATPYAQISHTYTATARARRTHISNDKHSVFSMYEHKVCWYERIRSNFRNSSPYILFNWFNWFYRRRCGRRACCLWHVLQYCLGHSTLSRHLSAVERIWEHNLRWCKEHTCNVINYSWFFATLNRSIQKLLHSLTMGDYKGSAYTVHKQTTTDLFIFVLLSFHITTPNIR